MQTRRTWGLLLASAAAGVVTAHMAAYAIAIPDGALRARRLAETGHGYWPAAVVVALIGGAGSVAAAGMRGRAVALAWERPPSTRRRWFGPALVGGQLGLFSLMEIGERVGSGIPTGTLVRDPAFLIGLAIQVAVVVVLLSVLGVIERGVELLVRARRRAPYPGRLNGAVVTDRAWVVVAWAGGHVGARGPPHHAFC